MTIKELRSMTGWSQSVFAAHFGVPVKTVQGWELRRMPPHYIPEMMERILKMEGILKDGKSQ